MLPSSVIALFKVSDSLNFLHKNWSFLIFYQKKNFIIGFARRFKEQEECTQFNRSFLCLFLGLDITIIMMTRLFWI